MLFLVPDCHIALPNFPRLLLELRAQNTKSEYILLVFESLRI